MQSVMSRPDLGYQLVGFVESGAGSHGQDFGRFKALGAVEDIAPLFAGNQIDEVIVALPASAHEESLVVLNLCEKFGVGLKLVPDLFEMSLSRVRVDDIAGIPLLDVRDRPLRRLETVVKRTLDILVAGILLVLTAPLLAILVLLIRLSSAGPALLRQQRVGLRGHIFACLKLRTMYPGSEVLQPALWLSNEVSGPLFKIRNDPRCTPIGRRIRRWSLDELPQLWNVLRGEMSVVGPRPALPSEVEQYSASQRKRLEAKPGLTGPWQVSGRSDLPFDEMVLMDINYVENWSLAFDVKILLRTIIAVFSRHGAY
jgi:exopolysaccharide biosynthesis polyprenyl glycosylphosphotransferase